MPRTAEQDLAYAAAVGRRIREARENVNLSQDALGDALEPYGIRADQTVISRWELGMRTPWAKAIAAIARVTKVSTDWLMGIEKPRNFLA